MKSRDLEFIDIPYGAPPFTCSCCSKEFTHGGRIASIEISKDAEFSIVVCNEKCERNFKEHPLSDKWIAEHLAKVKIHHSNQR